ncbi:MAG: hypothetical protein RRA94_12060 [Bacteroidota bacterium]|nr:hypothetical protein [Bacteroidota bacterium]
MIDISVGQRGVIFRTTEPGGVNVLAAIRTDFCDVPIAKLFLRQGRNQRDHLRTLLLERSSDEDVAIVINERNAGTIRLIPKNMKAVESHFENPVFPVWREQVTAEAHGTEIGRELYHGCAENPRVGYAIQPRLYRPRCHEPHPISQHTTNKYDTAI